MTPPVFTPKERERVRDYLLDKARADPRIVAGASVGSDSLGHGDRWSDLDLTFGLAPGITPQEVLDDWTNALARAFNSVHLFDLPSRTTVYRVFLFPGNLQVDLSFTPGFVAEYGPKFKLLFGDAVRREYFPPEDPRHMLGLGVHHAVRARYSIERGRPWQAEHWINGVRDQALSLACHRRGLEVSHGRGYDRLPPDVLDVATRTLVRSPERAELLRALRSSIELLVLEAEEARDFAAQLAPALEGLALSDWAQSTDSGPHAPTAGRSARRTGRARRKGA